MCLRLSVHSIFTLSSHSRDIVFFFFFNDTATTEIYTLSLHDALPILQRRPGLRSQPHPRSVHERVGLPARDRKSTRLNSSHSQISYAVFCLKKKKTQTECDHLPHRRHHYVPSSDYHCRHIHCTAHSDN